MDTNQGSHLRSSAFVATAAPDHESGSMNEATILQLAVAASRHGDARLAARARDVGTSAFTDLLDNMSDVELGRVRDEAASLSARGVAAVLLGSPKYPSLLGLTRSAPPFLFYLGSSELLTTSGIGVCGSRDATDEGLHAARVCAEVATEQGLTIISGYARGVDTATHTAALASGGTTIVVLPEGIDRFRVKRGPISEVWDPKRVLAVSQFSPNRPWSAGSAMARNNVIIGLSLALVVVEAHSKGGTLAAGERALQLNKRVFALEFSKNPLGNAALVERGAIPVRNRIELRSRLAETTQDPQGNQLSII